MKIDWTVPVTQHVTSRASSRRFTAVRRQIRGILSFRRLAEGRRTVNEPLPTPQPLTYKIGQGDRIR